MRLGKAMAQSALSRHEVNAKRHHEESLGQKGRHDEVIRSKNISVLLYLYTLLIDE
jgi:hypothetical protein